QEAVGNLFDLYRNPEAVKALHESTLKKQAFTWNDVFFQVKTALTKELDRIENAKKSMDHADVEKLFVLASETVECATKNFQYNSVSLENVLELVVGGLDQPFRRRHFQHNFLSMISSLVASNPYFMQTISKEQWKALKVLLLEKCTSQLRCHALMSLWKQGNRHGDKGQWTFKAHAFVLSVVQSTDKDALLNTILIVSEYCQQTAQSHPWDAFDVFGQFAEAVKSMGNSLGRFSFEALVRCSLTSLFY
ncbi:unnamed protein product, partial [Cyprideis torosa]